MLNIHMTMAEAFYHVAGLRRNQPALACGEIRFTYGELLDLTLHLVRGLHDLDLRKGDRVVAFLSPGADYACLFFALAELGGVFVPLNPQLRPRSMSQVLQDADPLMLVTERPLDEDSFTHPAGLKHVLHAPGAGDLNPTLGELAVSGKTDPLPPVDV